jgi:hypothetical protein
MGERVCEGLAVAEGNLVIIDPMGDAKPLTLEEVTKEIDATEWGEYGADHDWSPSFSFDDKVAVFSSLLDRWDDCTPEARGAVLRFLAKLLKDRVCETGTLPDALVVHSGIEALSPAMTPGFCSGFFSLQLLTSMKARNSPQSDWIAAIAARCEAKHFSETIKMLRRGDVYAKVQALLLEFR